MEEKKNNALEKAESRTESVKKGEAQNSHANREKKRRARALKVKQRKMMAKKSAEEKEREDYNKRVELARISAHNKAEKQKAKAAALREKNRRVAEHKARKQQLKAEKEARRELYKSQSRKERLKRKAERAAALRAERREKRQDKKGYGGWLAAVISLSVATLVLASALTFTFLMPTETDTALEATYRKSFYDTVDQVDNIDLNLSKVLATSDKGAMQKYLVDTAINSELAENDLQQLPLQDESKHYTTKLINQIGDYAKYLNNKIINGEEITDADVEGLNQLYKGNLAFKNALQKMIEEMGTDYSFSSLMEGGDGNLIISDFNELENLSVEYPELIYDGPFSDGQNQREIKGLSGEEIDAATALDKFNALFSGYGVENAQSDGVTTGDMECFNVVAEKDGEVVYAQFSKKGGKLIMFAYAGSCKEVKCEQADAIATAEEFLEGLEITDMKAVWINLSNNVYTINFAYEVDDVVAYPDLIKVRVCAETQTVIGIEAKSYYTNHFERVVETPALSEAEAEQKVSKNIDVETARLAIVPVGEKSEKLCYEFTGTFDGSLYYVYIDAVSGRQVEMFKVIESTEGTLLL